LNWWFGECRRLFPKGITALRIDLPSLLKDAAYCAMIMKQEKVITGIWVTWKFLIFSPRHKHCSPISGTMWTIGGQDMRTVTFEISERGKINKRFLRALEGESQGASISFESPALLFKVLSGKRWDLLKVLTGAKPVTIRELARRLGRDVKAVHGDVHTLLKAGVLQKTENGHIIFPFDAIHVDFMMKAA
jgi:predicted transcriptional regulator